ncbi:MAG TPA: cytochrome c [Xanthobacteraceae bacterium]|jgi:mono/diheme cytochrome c family protein|nr:cytochrome c [Xanthobacteraceae bacterium]
MRGFVRSVFFLCLLLIVGIAVYAIFSYEPPLGPIPPPQRESFDQTQVKRGAELAAIGSCGVCHTAPSGREFAGGVGLPTPFGAIYSTNITPDPETGIGNWSLAAFQRALRRGVRRDGAYLYPAFPYDHFTLVSDDDAKALYAFLMTREPVRATAPANQLPFPLNVRLVMSGWNLLFLKPGPYQPDPARDDAYNRGAYLAEGLGHCGSCHTPRNVLGAEKTSEKFAGGEAEGWSAYAINASSPAPVPWTEETLLQYLSHGFNADHGVARGPMLEVASNLGAVPNDDLHALATYIAAQIGRPAAPTPQVAKQLEAQGARGKTVAAASADSQADPSQRRDATAGDDEGALIYTATCSGCHQGPRAAPFGGIDFALSSNINGPSAKNLVNVVLNGLPAAGSKRTPIMPGFANAMDDRQVAALARYLRGHFTDKPAWTDIESSLNDARAALRAPKPNSAPSSGSASPDAS